MYNSKSLHALSFKSHNDLRSQDTITISFHKVKNKKRGTEMLSNLSKVAELVMTEAGWFQRPKFLLLYILYNSQWESDLEKQLKAVTSSKLLQDYFLLCAGNSTDSPKLADTYQSSYSWCE